MSPRGRGGELKGTCDIVGCDNESVFYCPTCGNEWCDSHSVSKGDGTTPPLCKFCTFEVEKLEPKKDPLPATSM